jgi:hypothetical protein
MHMPRGKKRNKSQAIRDVLTAKPEMTGKEVVAALAAKGINVADNLVYFIKGKMKAKTQRRKHVVRAARAASANGDAVTLIREVKALAGRAGGIGKLQELVEALAE